eukprot:TRINITY_DN5910_c0_g1_i13.p1 TRINITY_DN5910_c0_g1~~TRINITY_DN5910_c0_g1_i13.p1  ORF type:complete len:339 (+),score=115.26 TRINITY_DN5910_c0_g1_i13:1899-2915(+)
MEKKRSRDDDKDDFPTIKWPKLQYEDDDEEQQEDPKICGNSECDHTNCGNEEVDEAYIQVLQSLKEEIAQFIPELKKHLGREPTAALRQKLLVSPEYDGPEHTLKEYQQGLMIMNALVSSWKDVPPKRELTEAQKNALKGEQALEQYENEIVKLEIQHKKAFFPLAELKLKDDGDQEEEEGVLPVSEVTLQYCLEVPYIMVKEEVNDHVFLLEEALEKCDEDDSEDEGPVSVSLFRNSLTGASELFSTLSFAEGFIHLLATTEVMQATQWLEELEDIGPVGKLMQLLCQTWNLYLAKSLDVLEISGKGDVISNIKTWLNTFAAKVKQTTKVRFQWKLD